MIELPFTTPAEFDEIEASATAMAKSKAATHGLVFTAAEQLAVEVGINAGIMAVFEHAKQKRVDDGV